MRANLKQFEEQQDEYAEYYKKLIDESNDKKIEI